MHREPNAIQSAGPWRVSMGTHWRADDYFFIFLLKDGAEQEMAHAPGDSEAPVEVREAAGVQQRPPSKRPAAAIPQSVQYK
jgi:hypothetical protein